MTPRVDEAGPTRAGGPAGEDGSQAWRPYAQRLARRLTATGVVRDPRLREAFAATPRDRFVSGPLVVCSDDRWWLESAYADDALTPGELSRLCGPRITPAARASRPPSVIARALELLEVPASACGGRVLLCDLADGYVAALLCHLLGADHRDRLVCVAGETSETSGPSGTVRVLRRLAALGFRPRVVADLDAGLDAGPFVGILGEAITAVPPGWIGALAADGRIVARWSTPLGAVPLLLVRSGPGRVIGQTCADPESAYWWPPGELSPTPAAPHGGPGGAGVRLRPVTHHDLRWTEVDPRWLTEPSLRRLLALRDPTLQPPLTTRDRDEDATDAADAADAAVTVSLLRDTAGSWVELSEHTPRGSGLGGERAVVRTVIEGGPRRLWPVIEQTAHAWRYRARPDPTRYGLIAHTDGTHAVWIDDPDHPLPDPATAETDTPTTHQHPAKHDPAEDPAPERTEPTS